MTITDHETDTMLARVRKLLAKAEDPAATVGEAETYTAKAGELMARYGIDRALLAASDPSLDIVGDRVVVLDRPYAAEKGQLVSEIALSLGCRVVRRTRYPDGTKQLSVHLFGHRSDLQRAGRSWLVGFAAAVGRRLDAVEEAAAARAEGDYTARGTSTAVVLADRSTAVEAARDAAYPHLQRARTRQLSGSGHADGWGAGQRADLGGTRLRGRRALRR